MTRVELAEALRIYNLESGMTSEEAEIEARRLHAWTVQLAKGKGSADIHLHDFYLVASEEDGEFYLDRSQLDAALENLRTRQADEP